MKCYPHENEHFKYGNRRSPDKYDKERNMNVTRLV